jgi:hypothetical protein
MLANLARCLSGMIVDLVFPALRGLQGSRERVYRVGVAAVVASFRAFYVMCPLICRWNIVVVLVIVVLVVIVILVIVILVIVVLVIVVLVIVVLVIFVLVLLALVIVVLVALALVIVVLVVLVFHRGGVRRCCNRNDSGVTTAAASSTVKQTYCTRRS